MLNMTKENLEKWRASFKATYTNIAHPDLDSICDAALSALSQPKDVKRPDFMHPFDIADNVADSPKMTAEHILQLQAYIEQQPTAQGWRPISEAPKDGSNVWLSNGILVISGFWDGKGWFVGGDWGYLSDAGKHKRAPTHWHPDTKPQPPRSEVSNG